MPGCSFCKREVERGSGSVLIRNDGSVLWFCSSKCSKVWSWAREPRKTRWTAEWARLKKARVGKTG